MCAVVVKFNHLPTIARAIEAGMQQAVNVTAARTAGSAKDYVPSLDFPGPTATDALKTAIHIATPERSQYAEATRDARLVREMAEPPLDKPLQPELNPEEKPPKRLVPGIYTAWVIAPTKYAAYLEFGKIRANRAPGPFMRDAAEENWPEFVRSCTLVLKRLTVLEGMRQVGIQRERYEQEEMTKANIVARQAQQDLRQELIGSGEFSMTDVLRRTRRRPGQTKMTLKEAYEEAISEAMHAVQNNRNEGGVR